MAGLTASTHIDAPPERVFALASDFEHAADTIGAITKVEMLTEGPVGVGTRFRETRVMFKREASEEMEVTAFDPPRGYALGATSCGCRYHTEFRFAPSGAGTDVSFVFEATPLTLVGKVMSVVMRPMLKMMRKALLSDLADLKARAEGPPGRERGGDARSTA